MPDLLPLFLNLAGRDVVLVGGGRVATAKLEALLAAGAKARIVAPEVTTEIERAGAEGEAEIIRREFAPADLDGAWLVVAAATSDVNRDVAAAAESRRIFVNAVDDPVNASAFLSGTVRRDGVTLAISTSGDAPALTSLLREALDELLPADLDRWMAEARGQRTMWKHEAVPIESRKPRLLKALNDLYNSEAQGANGRVQPSGIAGHRAEDTEQDAPATGQEAQAAGQRVQTTERERGHVSLVGAGPGDPGLLTRKAIARLRTADLVLYDALIDDRILRYARKAQRFFVGKRAGRHAMTQQTIHSVMIRAARRRRRVVRLKGGDPFVFGRGGEEALALQQAGVPFDIVPGVTSAIAAPTLAGIPLTYRGVSSAFLVVSGHDDARLASAIGNVQPKGVTLIVLMGIARSMALAATLVGRGWSRETPAAIVANASAADQLVWRGTLDQLAETGVGSLLSRDARRLPIPCSGPGILVVGEVVGLAAEADTTFERTYVTGR